MSANESQVGGTHYVKYGELQPWDVIHRLKLGFFEGVIFKYLCRWQDKNGVEDLKKARHFLDKLIELHEGEQAATLHRRCRELKEPVRGGPYDLLTTKSELDPL
jgi:hypothetical protein